MSGCCLAIPIPSLGVPSGRAWGQSERAQAQYGCAQAQPGHVWPSLGVPGASLCVPGASLDVHGASLGMPDISLGRLAVGRSLLCNFVGIAKPCMPTQCPVPLQFPFLMSPDGDIGKPSNIAAAWAVDREFVHIKTGWDGWTGGRTDGRADGRALGPPVTI